MKFASQICTTKEQSERLLALGLKKETADMCWQTTRDVLCTFPYKEAELFFSSKGLDKDKGMQAFLPAWSLNRLLELLHIHHIDIWWNDGVYESVIEYVEEAIKTGGFPKKYLEE